jgi:hypothetical protein
MHTMDDLPLAARDHRSLRNTGGGAAAIGREQASWKRTTPETRHLYRARLSQKPDIQYEEGVGSEVQEATAKQGCRDGIGETTPARRAVASYGVLASAGHVLSRLRVRRLPYWLTGRLPSTHFFLLFLLPAAFTLTLLYYGTGPLVPRRVPAYSHLYIPVKL